MIKSRYLLVKSLLVKIDKIHSSHPDPQQARAIFETLREADSVETLWKAVHFGHVVERGPWNGDEIDVF